MTTNTRARDAALKLLSKHFTWEEADTAAFTNAMRHPWDHPQRKFWSSVRVQLIFLKPKKKPGSRHPFMASVAPRRKAE